MKDSIKDFKASDYWETAVSLSEDMKGCESVSARIGEFELPDGRTAQIQVIITADEYEFIGD